jgi:hypothetical protein
VADGSGKKSDPPVGTGRGLKLCASKAAERGRSQHPSGLVSLLPLPFIGIFDSCNIADATHLASRSPKDSKANMLAAAFAGLATNQIA